MSNWTKGPWVADKYGMGVDTECKDLPLLRTHGLGCDNTHICTMDDGEYVEYADHEEMRANANLIAAAPELYEALESTTRELRIYIERENDRLRNGITMSDLDEPDWHDMQTICENEKLLAKARGEKS